MKNHEHTLGRRALLTAAALMGAWAPLPALAQAWPTRPIRLVIPFGAGAASDMVARRIGERLQVALGQPVVVENKAGASGQIAAELVARAAPDGYTIFLTSNTTHSANPFLYKKLNYDPVKDFTPIARVCAFPFVLVVESKMPVANVKELVAFARSTGNTSYGYGNSTGQIAGAAFSRLTQMDSVAVPYKSVPQVVTDLLGGQVQYAFVDMANALPQIQAGKLKALAVSSEVPTITEETGLQGFDLTAWGAVFGPAGMPKQITDRLATELARITTNPEFRERLQQAGVEAQTSTPEELRVFVDRQLVVWGAKVKDARIQPE
jgi:tripartite-type tricarboxylate transporter receptor subunit TctC